MPDSPRGRLLRKLEKRFRKVAIESDISDTDFVILAAVAALTPTADVNPLIELIREEIGDILDVAQVYVTLRCFEKETGWVCVTGTEKPNDIGPYGLSEKGRQMLAERDEHLSKLRAFYARVSQLRKMVAVRKDPD